MKNVAACLKFTKDDPDDLEDYRKHSIWTDKAKIELYGLNEKLDGTLE